VSLAGKYLLTYSTHWDGKLGQLRCVGRYEQGFTVPLYVHYQHNVINSFYFTNMPIVYATEIATQIQKNSLVYIAPEFRNTSQARLLATTNCTGNSQNLRISVLLLSRTSVVCESVSCYDFTKAVGRQYSSNS